MNLLPANNGMTFCPPAATVLLSTATAKEAAGEPDFQLQRTLAWSSQFGATLSLTLTQREMTKRMAKGITERERERERIANEIRVVVAIREE